MRQLQKSLHIALALLGIISISGCAHAPHEAGVLHLAQTTDATSLDPAKAYDTTSIQFVRLLYRGLVDYDYQANIVNELAERRAVSPDGKTYTFWLHKGVRYHDGTPVRAADFRYALERVLDPNTASDGSSFYGTIDGAKEWTTDRAPDGPHKLQHIRGIEVVGDNEVIFHLTRPDATFLNYLTLPFSYAVSQAWVEKVGAKALANEQPEPGMKPGEIAERNAKIGSKALSDNPNGCGPFKMKEWVHDGWLTLEKNADYFKPQFPKVNRIEARFGISSSLQIMLYQQGAIDVLPISDAFPPDFLYLTRTKPWKDQIVHAPMMDMRYLCLNNELKPFTDIRVRQAMNYAINRDRILGFLTGRATKARGALPPGMPGYNPQLFQYSYDPAKSRQLLKEAGYTDDPTTPIPLLYSTSEPWYGKAAQSIKNDLKQVGMSVDIKVMSYGDLKAQAGQRGKSKMALMGWLQDFPDPSNFLDPLFNKSSIHDVSSLNRAFYSNPKVNAILDAAAIETNQPKRLKMYQDAEKIIVHDAPDVFLHHTERYVIRQPWVKGFKLHPMWSAVYENVEVD